MSFWKELKRRNVVKVGAAYWNKFGWPDMCHKLDNGDFECDG
jgi:hypothetical protein